MSVESLRKRLLRGLKERPTKEVQNPDFEVCRKMDEKMSCNICSMREECDRGEIITVPLTDEEFVDWVLQDKLLEAQNGNTI